MTLIPGVINDEGMQREKTEGLDCSSVFGSNLAAARTARGISQRELAELSGISSAAISRYESHDRKSASSLPTVLRLARALRVHIAWLLLNEGPRDLDAPVIAIQIDATTPNRLRELADQLESGFVTPKSDD